MSQDREEFVLATVGLLQALLRLLAICDIQDAADDADRAALTVAYDHGTVPEPAILLLFVPAPIFAMLLILTLFPEV